MKKVTAFNLDVEVVEKLKKIDKGKRSLVVNEILREVLRV